MYQVYVDTNIYLSFYEFSKQDLEELKKLVSAIDEGLIGLVTTDHTIDEFKKNRDSTVSRSLKYLNKYSFATNFPQFCSEYESYKKLRKNIVEGEDNLNTLKTNLEDDIKKEALAADRLTQTLFDKATVYKTSKKIYSCAHKRKMLGKPPGKGKTCGDQLNWELLLDNSEKGKTLYLISQDGDYSSNIDKDELHPFLREEWEKHTESEIHYFKDLAVFFKKHFPDIKLAEEFPKEMAVRRLEASSSFSETHYAIRELNKYVSFDDKQYFRILKACTTNGQITRISTDEDVSDFANTLYDEKGSLLPEELQDEFVSIYKVEEEEIISPF
jgi:hypothetical protein